jgi:hypothetical protein
MSTTLVEPDCSMMIASKCVEQFDTSFCCNASTVIAPTGEHEQVDFLGEMVTLPVLDKYLLHEDGCAYRRLHALPGKVASWARKPST